MIRNLMKIICMLSIIIAIVGCCAGLNNAQQKIDEVNLQVESLRTDANTLDIQNIQNELQELSALIHSLDIICAIERLLK